MPYFRSCTITPNILRIFRHFNVYEFKMFREQINKNKLLWKVFFLGVFFVFLNEMSWVKSQAAMMVIKDRQLRKVVVLCYFKTKHEQKKDELVSANACL